MSMDIGLILIYTYMLLNGEANTNEELQILISTFNRSFMGMTEHSVLQTATPHEHSLLIMEIHSMNNNYALN